MRSERQITGEWRKGSRNRNNFEKEGKGKRREMGNEGKVLDIDTRSKLDHRGPG